MQMEMVLRYLHMPLTKTEEGGREGSFMSCCGRCFQAAASLSGLAPALRCEGLGQPEAFLPSSTDDTLPRPPSHFFVIATPWEDGCSASPGAGRVA